MKYNKPRSFNLVTVLLFGGAGLAVYILVYLWPVYSASSRAKGILYDHVPALYRANLRGSDVSRSMMEDIKISIAKELEKAGINDKAAKIPSLTTPTSSRFPPKWYPTRHGSTGKQATVVQSPG
jgi:hypothetical protein